MLRRIRVFVSSIVVGVSILGGSALATSFQDVPSNHWSFPSVVELHNKGVINGYPDGSFKPNDTLSTDAFVKMTVVALGGRVREPHNGEDWFQPYLEEAVRLDIVKSWEIKTASEGRRPIPRYQIARILARAIDIDGTQVNSSIENSFRDLNNDKFAPFVIKATNNGLLTGYPDGTFKGDSAITRAEASVVIHRLSNKNVRIKNVNTAGTSGSSLGTTNPSNNSKYNIALAEAERLLKKRVPYVFGGNSEDTGFDCSRYMQIIFSKAGVEIGRVTSLQERQGVAVLDYGDVRKGDLIFFDFKDTPNGITTHVGMYIGDNKMIHTGNARNGIEHRYLNSWYLGRITNIRRVI